MKIEVGTRFGSLVTTREGEKNTHGDVMYMCKCDCGGERYVRGYMLRNGQVTSCTKCKYDYLIGQRFERLKVVSRTWRRGRTYFNCVCDCGKSTCVDMYSLTSGRIKSCGCYNRELCLSSSTTHGMSKTRFYAIWNGMRQRCENSSIPMYRFYGARGVKVCDRWKKFENFREDMYESYQKHVEEFGENDTSLDRINSFGNYESSNCRWATDLEQQNNRRNNHIISINGENMTVAEASRKFNIKYSTLLNIVNAG